MRVMALFNSKHLIGPICISLKSPAIKREKKSRSVCWGLSDRSLLYFKERTSAHEKLSTNSGPSSPFLPLPARTCFLAFLSSGDNRYLFAGASCHPSTLPGLVTTRQRPGSLEREKIGCDVVGCGGGLGLEGGWGISGCQEIWHQGQGWRLKLTQPSDGDDKRPESTLKLSLHFSASYSAAT